MWAALLMDQRGELSRVGWSGEELGRTVPPGGFWDEVAISLDTLSLFPSWGPTGVSWGLYRAPQSCFCSASRARGVPHVPQEYAGLPTPWGTQAGWQIAQGRCGRRCPNPCSLLSARGNALFCCPGLFWLLLSLVLSPEPPQLPSAP